MNYKTMRLCDIARKMGVSLEEAKRLKDGKPPKKMKIETEIKESDNVKTDL